MNLTIVSPFPPPITGIGEYGYHLSRALKRSKNIDRITILAGKTSQTNTEEHDYGIVIERVWKPGSILVGRQIASRLRQLKPDLVWFNFGASIFGNNPLTNISGLLSPLANQLIQLPSVVTLHEMVELVDLRALNAPGGPLAGLGAKLITRISTHADVVCVTLRRYAHWLGEKRPGLKVVHIPHGTFNPPRLLPNGNHHDLLMFSTHAPFKGLELLLQAFTSLQSRYPELRLTVAGAEHPRTPGYLDRVRSSFQDQNGVRWLGSIPDKSLPDLFGQSTLVILPYLATTGSSSVLYRAATWGRAIIASDLPELLATAHETGLKIDVFRKGDSTALAAVIEQLILDPARRLAQVEHNLKAVSRVTLEDTARSYLEVFELALAAHRQAHPLTAPTGSRCD